MLWLRRANLKAEMLKFVVIARTAIMTIKLVKYIAGKKEKRNWVI